MIELHNVSKSYPTVAGRKVVLDRLSLTLPWGAKVGVLGRNGAGKSTLLGMISGTVRPDAGRIRRHASISWPLGSLAGQSDAIRAALDMLFLGF